MDSSQLPPKLGRLEAVSPREVWTHEAHDFTRWMLANADVLSDALGMQLELTRAEHRVGGFSLDLIGKDAATGGTVIVENQLEQTDHNHLGQLLTYAGGTDPTNVVWCATAFREEHRAALDWLNAHTDEETRFFGVEVGVVRIGSSEPAPLFRLVAQPNDWRKQVHSPDPAAPRGKGLLYAEFWSTLLDRIRIEHPDWTSSTRTTSAGWFTLPFGTSAIWYEMIFTKKGLRCELNFGSSDAEANLRNYRRYEAHRQLMEDTFGAELSFEPLPENKACRIAFDLPGGDVSNTPQHDAYIDWFLATHARLRLAANAARAVIAGEDANA